MEPNTLKPMITRLGGPVNIARWLTEKYGVKISHSAVCQWKQIPADHVPALVALSQDRDDPITAKEMRPDLPWEVITG